MQSPPPARAGHLFVAFNNATAADSVRLLEKFARWGVVQVELD